MVGFAFFLTCAIGLTGIICLYDYFIWRKRRNKHQRIPKFVEFSRAFFPILLAVFILRSFIIQPYRVPTGSLEPTVMPGDFIAVAQYAYGIRFPIGNAKIISTGEPKRGDIALFRWPKRPDIIFVKRVIGLPGDSIVYKNKVLYINGKEATQQFISKVVDENEWGYQRKVYLKEEDLDGIKHEIYVQQSGGETQDYDLIVPKGAYFMMGDNRDNSDDSRQWGFVPEKDLIGKAFVVWMSWDAEHHTIRWHRIGTTLH